jgi:hypothetical protein
LPQRGDGTVLALDSDVAAEQWAKCRLMLGCVVLRCVGGCSAEEVQPANTLPGASRAEAAAIQSGAGALEPAGDVSGNVPAEVPLPAATSGGSPEDLVVRSAALPDLVLDSSYLLDTTRFETQRIDDPCVVQQGCATGLGERRVVRFGSRMGNLGKEDLVLGVPGEENPLWSRDSCGDGFSLRGFARYELRDSGGRRVLQGSKSQFCITDAEEWIPGSGADCQNFSCGRQGIAPGCADNYGTDLPCQWLDVTDVAPGAYELEVTLNAERSVAELDYTNNSTTVRLQISATGGGVER